MTFGVGGPEVLVVAAVRDCPGRRESPRRPPAPGAGA